VSIHRFLAGSLAGGETAPITGDELHRLRDVLRLRPGDHIVLADGAGEQFAAVLESVGRDEAIARVLAPLGAPALTRITLFQSILKSAKMDLVVQKATELGVRAVVPVRAERCVAKVDEPNRETKLGRWRRVAGEAAKQCGRASVPEVCAPVDMDAASAKLGDYARSIVFWEEAKSASLQEALFGVGAEGGVAGANLGLRQVAESHIKPGQRLPVLAAR